MSENKLCLFPFLRTIQLFQAESDRPMSDATAPHSIERAATSVGLGGFDGILDVRDGSELHIVELPVLALDLANINILYDVAGSCPGQPSGCGYGRRRRR